MSNRYFINGVISVSIGKDLNRIFLTPSTGFISQLKPKRAIALPISEEDVYALLIFLDKDTKIELASSIPPYLWPLLMQIAGMQQLITLEIESVKRNKFKIVGFTFPAD